jgi:hypothetical protein
VGGEPEVHHSASKTRVTALTAWKTR